MNPLVKEEDNVLYLFYNKDINIDKIICNDNIINISLYIDEIFDNSVIDLLFLICDLKKYNIPLFLITSLPFENIPKYVIRYFEYIVYIDNVEETMQNIKSMICNEIYIKGFDY